MNFPLRRKRVTVLGIIPARGGSKRIPHKNIVEVAGRPLIAYAIRAAARAKSLDACIVSTDDQRIAYIAKLCGADVPFLRPKRYARDASRDIEYLRHALRWLEERRGWKPDIVVALPPDVPTRTPGDIDGAVGFLIRHHFDSVRTLVPPSPPIPYKAMWTLKRGKGKQITPLFPEYVGVPRQLLPEYFFSVGVAYVMKSKFIRRGEIWGGRVGGYLLPAGKHVEIDEPEDLRRAAALLGNRKRT